MKTMKTCGLVLCLLVLGCSSSEESSDANQNKSTATGSTYVVDTEPADAQPVGAARASATDGQKLTLVGIIGGSSEPFVDGLAAFTIVDPKVPYCAPEEGCPTPWDYCCTQDQVQSHIATVKVVDESGSPVASDAKTLLGVKELSTVVVSGTANVDEQGNLSLSATQVFVRSE